MKFFFPNSRRTTGAASPGDAIASPASNDQDFEPESIPAGKAEFIRNITHDIKGDFFGVSSVCLILRLAIEKKEDPITILDRLTEACAEYKYKLNNFLEYTKLDAGLRDTLREPVNLRSLLAASVEEAGNRALPKAINIDLAVSELLPVTITSDEFRLRHVTENLLVNAIDFSAPGGHIAVKAEKKENCWLLSVSDHGMGMTPEQLESLFKWTPVERRSLKNPTGLGLLVTRYLVEDVMQGKLSFACDPGRGTRVEIELPLD